MKRYRKMMMKTKSKFTNPLQFSSHKKNDVENNVIFFIRFAFQNDPIHGTV